VPSPKKLPDGEVLVGLAKSGLSNLDIGDRYGVTAEAVRQALVKSDYHRPRIRPSHAYYLPWRVRADHVGDVLARRLRSYSKRQQGRKITASETRLLDEWLQFMNGDNSTSLRLSVHYSRSQGFWLQPQVPGDRDFIHPPPVDAETEQPQSPRDSYVGHSLVT